MIQFKVERCPKCGRIGEIIFSNNPIVPGICAKCINAEFDPGKLTQADFFCRTYNIPFDPNKWIELYERHGDNTFKIYVSLFFETDKENLYHQGCTADLWGKLDEEWAQCKTYEAILARIEPIKNAFIARSRIKWGPNYTFEQLVQLENLLSSTMKAGDVSNPLRIDAIKKACKISIELDAAIEAGDAKGIKELSSSYTSFTKAAQLEEVIESDTKDVISTVAELADFIEKCGGRYTYYDGVSRDIVDKTIADLKEYLRNLVLDSTGLATMLETIAQQYRNNIEQNTADQAIASVSLDDLIADTAMAANHALDAELAQETLEDIAIEEDEDEYF